MAILYIGDSKAVGDRRVRPYYAHSLPGQPLEKWEPLYTGDGTGHLEKVAALAAEFAAKFGAAEWGRVVRLWHDADKRSAGDFSHQEKMTVDVYVYPIT